MVNGKALAALAVIAFANGAQAECRLALLIGLDISSSVDVLEDQLQRGGTAAALRAPEVVQAFFATDQTVALAAFEWSGRYNQHLVLDWTMIDTPAALSRAADVIATSRRSHNEFPTAMGEALFFAAEMMDVAPQCLRQTVDMAGDGENNEGPRPGEAYALPQFDAITVNGLVVINAAEYQIQNELTKFYYEEVIHGPGAFVIEADGFEDYRRAIREKLEREVRPPTISALERRKQAG